MSATETYVMRARAAMIHNIKSHSTVVLTDDEALALAGLADLRALLTLSRQAERYREALEAIRGWEDMSSQEWEARWPELDKRHVQLYQKYGTNAFIVIELARETLRGVPLHPEGEGK